MTTASGQRDDPPFALQHYINEHGLDGEAAIVRADFASRQIDGSNRFVVQRSVGCAGGVVNLVPKALEVRRIVSTAGNGVGRTVAGLPGKARL